MLGAPTFAPLFSSCRHFSLSASLFLSRHFRMRQSTLILLNLFWVCWFHCDFQSLQSLLRILEGQLLYRSDGDFQKLYLFQGVFRFSLRPVGPVVASFSDGTMEYRKPFIEYSAQTGTAYLSSCKFLAACHLTVLWFQLKGRFIYDSTTPFNFSSKMFSFLS